MEWNFQTVFVLVLIIAAGTWIGSMITSKAMKAEADRQRKEEKAEWEKLLAALSPTPPTNGNGNGAG